MTDLLARLAQHRALGAAPVAEHEWLVAHGTPRTLAVGEVLTHKGQVAVAFHIFLSGHVVIRADRGAGSHKVIEWHGGDLGGLLPFSRKPKPPNDSVAEETTELLDIAPEDLPELIRECPAVTAASVWAMVDRSRQFTTSDLRDEKLISLGKLAAGLAHELNNPASAAVRSAKLLGEALAASEVAALQLGALRLTDAQLAALAEMRNECLRKVTVPRSALDLADREDAFAEWLGAHGVSTECAVPLAETNLTLDQLDALAASITREAINAALKWLAAGCMVRSLSSGIETSATRINDLVGAVKGFTFMDRAHTPEPVDIRRGITDTLTVLGAKLHSKSVTVTLGLPEDLPHAHGVGVELNQVWMNLIDNAVDAVPVGGQIEVTASLVPGRVVIHIVDDGAGIPTDIQARIFDPFFTTKGVGKGTGLGLDIVRRVVQRHEGEVEVESRPGRTEFRVSLPTA